MKSNKNMNDSVRIVVLGNAGVGKSGKSHVSSLLVCFVVVIAVSSFI